MLPVTPTCQIPQRNISNVGRLRHDRQRIGGDWNVCNGSNCLYVSTSVKFTIRSSSLFCSANRNDGTPGGLSPLLRLFDASVALTNSGGNRRPSAITVYIEPWHTEILTFLTLKSSRGNESLKAKKLFYGLWIPDILYVILY